MTNKEAINVLKMVEAHGLAAEAKRMAIEALIVQEERRGRWLDTEPMTICAEERKDITIERIDRQIDLLKALKGNLEIGKKIIDQLERF